jgi:Tfp pilus assembly protein PilO
VQALNKILQQEIKAREATITHQVAEITALKQRLAVLGEIFSRMVVQQPTQTAQR